MGKVRLHPLPAGASARLATVVAAAVRGAVKDALNAHCSEMSCQKRGMLVGSIGKRAVNQLVSEEGERAIREALSEAE